jgi:hypothetical protein
MTRSMTLTMLVLPFCVAGTGCVHRIQVAPLPVSVSPITIPRTLQTVISPISMVGPDHRPGIALLEWSHLDLNQAVLQYLQQRGTFASVSLEPADLTLHVAPKLTLTSRQGLYHYRISLQAEMSEGTRLKSYRAEQTAVGSSVRWVTASDRDPIATALQAALEDLMKQIEADRSIDVSRTKPPSQQPAP